MYEGVSPSESMVHGQALKITFEPEKAYMEASRDRLQCFQNRQNVVWNAVYDNIDAEVVNE